ncbi:MAG TPA: hypothetical protein VJY41_09055 [Prolixibacteraceae bacterium]|nr:hypothetical protein [Prolixibacteraceae bacterium]
MRRIKQLIIIACLFVFFMNMAACDKNDPTPGEIEEELVFELLSSNKDTLRNGEGTTIQALARGTKLVYHWSASAGDILGSGSTVSYITTPCVAGTIEITCKIEDVLLNSDQKTIKLYIE